MSNRITAVFALLAAFHFSITARAEPLDLQLRYQVETSPQSGRFHRLIRKERWKPEETAIIVCDVWDSHHCLNAVRRVEQFAPRLNDVLNSARSKGVTIIHSPSDCMTAYSEHPARKRAVQTPKASNLPAEIHAWCSRIPSEEQAVYPIDQSDGGEDDDPREHAQWVAKLRAQGRNPGTPWKTQTSIITIDKKRDYISDRGVEVWNVLEQQGIKNVILTGVHTNMCVLGRPFGLRQMVSGGKNVALMRDMTDTMYNPKRWPFVSHFTGTDLIVSHIEKFVCPTITSDQLLGGAPFRFKEDRRPHLVMIIAEDEYETARTLPELAANYLGKNLRVSLIFGSDKERNMLPGLAVVRDADLLLISIRRRVLRPEDLKLIQEHGPRAGKPIIGIRTASHAFSLRGKKPPKGFAAWEDFDNQVFGGNYRNHFGNKLKSTISLQRDALQHPILQGLSGKPFAQAGSLYEVLPLLQGTSVLATGKVEGQPEQPVAWTYQRKDGGRSFYTSMGHPSDFQNAHFLRMFLNGIYWAAGIDGASKVAVQLPNRFYQVWSAVDVPAKENSQFDAATGPTWYRCYARLPQRWIGNESIGLFFEKKVEIAGVWLNGSPLPQKPTDRGLTFPIDKKSLHENDANLIVIKTPSRPGSIKSSPFIAAGSKRLHLEGRWQMRIGGDDSFSNIPLPAKFGGSTDAYFEP